MRTSRSSGVTRAPRGSGLDHDGLYYVRSVTHQLERGSYTQSFSLSREGTMPTIPAVLP